MKYAAILADPPWTWQARSTKGEGRSARNHYDLMTLDDIKALRPMLDEVALPDSVLFLWATSPMLPQAFEVMAAWGFTFKTVGFVWVKKNRTTDNIFKGLGYWSRQNAEFILLGTRGHPKRMNKNVPQVLITERREHSRKPDEFYGKIESLAYGPYLEMFARQLWPWWDAWGHGVDRKGRIVNWDFVQNVKHYYEVPNATTEV